VSHAEKLDLLPELARRLDGALRDVTVRDVESIELAPAEEGPDGR
jgi:hypothetical protein